MRKPFVAAALLVLVSTTAVGSTGESAKASNSCYTSNPRTCAMEQALREEYARENPRQGRVEALISLIAAELWDSAEARRIAESIKQGVRR